MTLKTLDGKKLRDGFMIDKNSFALRVSCKRDNARLDIKIRHYTTLKKLWVAKFSTYAAFYQ